MPQESRTATIRCIISDILEWCIRYIYIYNPDKSTLLQECRQYKILVKDSEENVQKDWMRKTMRCKDSSSTSSESESDEKNKKKRKGNKEAICGFFPCEWGWENLLKLEVLKKFACQCCHFHPSQ